MNKNSYYWNVVVKMISELVKEESKVVHEYLKDKFLTKDQLIHRVDGAFSYGNS